MKVLLLAGEESGQIYARRIAAELEKTVPSVEIRGYADYGFATSDLAVFGFWEVLKRLFFFLRVKRTMEKAIVTWRPDVVCTVDYPGMNLKLAACAKAHGIRSVHVVCPQVWAWKAGRIPKIEASLTHLCCFFPFEPKLFKPGFATFVGHPLAEEFAAEEERRTKISARQTCVALLPGSRLGEIGRMLPTLLTAVEGLKAAFVIPAANDRAYAAIERLSAAFRAAHPGTLELRHGGARKVLHAADCAVVASGTATLEAALARCPTLLVYKVSPLLAAFLRRAITGVKHVGLANVIAEKAGAPCPMPELLQENFTVENVRRQLEKWLDDEASRQEAAARLDRTMSLLASTGRSMAKICEVLIDAR